MRNGKIDPAKAKLIDRDRLDEEHENFLLGSKGRVMHISPDKLKP